MVRCPDSRRFLISDTLDRKDEILFTNHFLDQVWYQTDPQSPKHPKVLTFKVLDRFNQSSYLKSKIRKRLEIGHLIYQKHINIIIIILDDYNVTVLYKL